MNKILTQLAATSDPYGGTTNKLNSGVDTKNTDLQGAVVNIINAVVGVLALICVIVIIIGGVNYMTSSGDAAKVKKAKDTILYGVIGLVICVLAFAIVNFVIANIIGAK